ACFEHSNFFKVTAPEARPGQLRPGAHRWQKGRVDRCTPTADRSAQPKDQPGSIRHRPCAPSCRRPPRGEAFEGHGGR
ncbi:hypothetical protein HN873_055902, partial [Arachis hypogaea]